MQTSTLYLDTPGRDYLDSFPLGNGSIGAIVSGRVSMERIALNHECLWRGLNRNIGATRKVTHTQLNEIRTAMFAGNYEKGRELSIRYLSGTSPADPNGLAGIQPYQPFGDMYLEVKHSGNYENYQRRLHLDRAMAEVSYQVGDVNYVREYFVSQPHNAIIIHIRASKDGALQANMWLNRIGDPQCQIERWAEGAACGLIGHFVEGIEFAAEARILSHDGCLSVDGQGRRLCVQNASEIVVAVAMAVDLDYHFPFSQPSSSLWCREHLAGLPFDYRELFKTHTEEYSPYYKRFRLELYGDERLELVSLDKRQKRLASGEDDPALFALYNNFGRYLLLSSSRKCNLPANLQGIWNEELLPPWKCYFSSDINLSMNYWSAEAWNLSECVEPLFKLLDRNKDGARRAAADYYGCRGLHYFTGDIWQLYCIIGDGWDWTGLAAMMAWHYWERYDYSRDLELLRTEVYPFIKEVATFYEDFLIPDSHGYLVANPTQSPENFFVYANSDEPGFNCYGATMDVLLSLEVLGHAIEAAELLDVDAELRTKWEKMIQALQPFKIGISGQLQEWIKDFEESEPGHRHFSHLYGVYPGNSMRPDLRTEAFNAAKVSLMRRLTHGAGQEGWSRAWATCLLVRFGETAAAYESLVRHLVDCSTEVLLDIHPYAQASSRRPSLDNAHQPICFEIDGNMGGAAAMLEMLAQSCDGVVKLLPALPTTWPDGEIHGMKLRGGLTLDMVWRDSKLQMATILAKHDSCIRLILPEGQYQMNGQTKRPCQTEMDINIRSGMVTKLELLEPGTVQVC